MYTPSIRSSASNSVNSVESVRRTISSLPNVLLRFSILIEDQQLADVTKSEGC